MIPNIDYDETMTIANSTSESSNNTKPKCEKLKGTLPKSGVSLCRIYMKKSNTKKDCDQFITHMEAKNKDPNNAVQFAVTSVSHHKQRPMIKAKLNMDAINMVNTVAI